MIFHTVPPLFHPNVTAKTGSTPEGAGNTKSQEKAKGAIKKDAMEEDEELADGDDLQVHPWGTEVSG